MPTGAPFDYKRSQQTADRLIGRFGKRLPAKIVRFTESGTPGRPVRTPVDYPCIAVELGIDEKEVTDLVRQTDKRIYISPFTPTGALLAISVTKADRYVNHRGEDHEIMSVGHLRPADDLVYHNLVVRL